MAETIIIDHDLKEKQDLITKTKLFWQKNKDEILLAGTGLLILCGIYKMGYDAHVRKTGKYIRQNMGIIVPKTNDKDAAVVFIDHKVQKKYGIRKEWSNFQIDIF